MQVETGSQAFLKGQSGCSGAAEPPMMIRLSTEVSMEGEGCHHLTSNEVKAKEVITSWKNSVLCVWVWGATVVNFYKSHLRLAGLKARLVIVLLTTLKQSLNWGSTVSVVSLFLCPSRLTQFTAYLSPPYFSSETRMTHGICFFWVLSWL